MPPKIPVSSLTRRSLTVPHVSLLITRRAYSHFPPTRRRRCSPQQAGSDCLLIFRRTLSTTPRRCLADIDDSFDPREQERESDEVDVCIVGGGMSGCNPPSGFAEFVSQDPPASAQPFASNKLPMKRETKTSGFCFSRNQVNSALTSSPVTSSNRLPSTNCFLTGMIRIIHRVSKMLLRLRMIRCAFSPKIALYQSPHLRRCTIKEIIS